MERLKIDPIETLKGIGIICLFFILSFILAIPFVFLLELKLINMQIANLGLYLWLALIFSLIYIKDLIRDFKDFKKNYKQMLKISLNYWIKGLFIMYVSSFIISILRLEENANQAANIDMLIKMPIIEIICSVILAPLTEELVFRRGLKKATNNKYLYAIITGLIFGLVHVTSSITSLKDLPMLLYIVPYSSLGVAFGLTYKETDNIFSTICIHALHNSISVGILLIGGIL